MNATTHTPGPWRVGHSGSVVADHPVPEMSGSDSVEYYGGHLVAESIAPRNRPVIAAAPELLDALARIIQWQNGSPWVGGRGLPPELADVARAAIAKAEGRS